jgi:hypothetical protein
VSPTRWCMSWPPAFSSTWSCGYQSATWEWPYWRSWPRRRNSSCHPRRSLAADTHTAACPAGRRLGRQASLAGDPVGRPLWSLVLLLATGGGVLVMDQFRHAHEAEYLQCTSADVAGTSVQGRPAQPARRHPADGSGVAGVQRPIGCGASRCAPESDTSGWFFRCQGGKRAVRASGPGSFRGLGSCHRHITSLVTLLALVERDRVRRRGLRLGRGPGR